MSKRNWGFECRRRSGSRCVRSETHVQPWKRIIEITSFPRGSAGRKVSCLRRVAQCTASPYLDLALLDDARPALQILLDERGECLRVAAVDLDAELGEAFPHRRVCEGFHGGVVKLADDVG